MLSEVCIVLYTAQVGYIALLVAVFAKIMQYLCKSPENAWYGEAPLSDVHHKIAKFLAKNGYKKLLKLHYCFICQSVWYSFGFIVFDLFYLHYLNHVWQYVSLPLLTFFFASLIIKDAFFIPVITENDYDNENL